MTAFKNTIIFVLLVLGGASAQAHNSINAWYFNLEGYELVYTYQPHGTRQGHLLSHRFFSAKAVRGPHGRVVGKGFSAGVGRCTHSVTFDPRDISQPQVLFQTNEIFKGYILEEQGRLQAYIVNRVTGELLVGKDIYQMAIDHGGEFELKNKNTLRNCFVGDSQITAKEHFDQLALRYDVPVVEERRPRKRYNAWQFDYGGYKLVYGYHYTGYMHGHVTSWPNFKITLVEDAFGDTQSIVEALPGGRFCSGSASMSDDQVPGPRNLSKTQGLFEIELQGEYQQGAVIRHRFTGEEIIGTPVEELAAMSPDRTFELRNRTTRWRCYVGQSKMTHKEFFKNLKSK